MAVDTIKLRSPSIHEGIAQFLEKQCVLKQGIDLSTGEFLYQITTGSLEGSWDSRISFQVCRKDWVIGPRGKLEHIECDPFVLVEASLHKFFYGQNVFGNPTNVQELCRLFINCLGEMFADDSFDADRFGKHGLLPDAFLWEVRRIDWAEMFRLSPAAQAEFFLGLKNCKFPRRALKEAKYHTAVHFPGKFTTVRIYGKGAEFKKHDHPRLKKELLRYGQMQCKGFNAARQVRQKALIDHTAYQWVNKKVDALQRLANNRLRAEIQINADKLHYDFKGRYPRVSEITDEYCIGIYDNQMFKLLKEGKSEMETVRTFHQVKSRLNDLFGKRAANNLESFWMKLAAQGEEVVRQDYSKAQFCKNRKKLMESGISWNSTDVFIVPQDTALPRDFIPLPSDSRRCTGKVSNSSIFNYCPVEQFQAKKAA